MEELKFSILTCVYGNHLQFQNFLVTAVMQDYGSYEIVVVDNATPNRDIYDSCLVCDFRSTGYEIGRNPDVPVCVRYVAIKQQDKKCKNIAQGINLAAREAKGKYLVIVADPNVLLSFNLLNKIDPIDEKSVYLSSGLNDVKISPTGSYDDEYNCGNPEKMAEDNEKLLEQMGWPADPLYLDLIPGKHRFPPPHLNFDCYIVALSKENFFKFGGYAENSTSWGEYHQNFVRNLTEKLTPKYLKNVQIIHQYHRVYKDDSI